MGLGYLKVETRTLNNILPVKDAIVIIKDKTGKVLYRFKTDGSGQTGTVQLEAPEKRRTLSPNYSGPFFYTYSVEVSIPEQYITVITEEVEIFDNITSILPVTMVPKPIDAGYMVDTRKIANRNMYILDKKEKLQENKIQDEEIFIPEYLIVHLGLPEEPKKNIRVGFSDYIKNVASSEIYPTWPNDSIEAIIYSIISFTLNRIFSKRYRADGYNFDITNIAKIDQAYVHRKRDI